MASKAHLNTKIAAETADAKRLDKVAAKLETIRGGSWSRPQALKWLLALGEKELSQPAEVAHA